MLGLGLYNPTTGAIAKSIVQLVLNVRSSGGSVQVLQRDFGSAEAPAAHPMTRGSDETVAFAQAPGGDYGIVTTTLPKAESGTFAVPDPTAAPAAINTAAPEQMPAWSPDDLKLAFVRTTSATRRLAVFDATPGIQSVVNAPFSLGAEAPTPQTRAIQSLWGGISLAEVADAAPTPTCTRNCLLSLTNANLTNTILRPIVTSPTIIGIFVARVTGTRRLLGRRVPRLRPVGRVPLGRARRRGNRFRWNGKVEGKRLRRGTYLLTFRTLRGKRITNTSGSIRFKVTKSGKLRGVRRQR
jgi:hypothetical protein